MNITLKTFNLNFKQADFKNTALLKVSSSPEQNRFILPNKNIENNSSTQNNISPQNTPLPKSKNKTLIFSLVGGITLIAGLILIAIKLKRGKTLPKINEIEKDIKNASQEIGDKIPKSVSHEELNASKNELIEQIIQLAQPKNEAIAREILPSLIDKSKLLGIGAEDFKKYLEVITPENKDFVIKEGINLLADNMEKIKPTFKNPKKAYTILEVLNAENKEILPYLLENKETLKIQTWVDLVTYLEELNSKNKDFAFNEVLPFITQHQDTLKLERGFEMAPIMGKITEKTKHIIEIIVNYMKKNENNSKSAVSLFDDFFDNGEEQFLKQLSNT